MTAIHCNNCNVVYTLTVLLTEEAGKAEKVLGKRKKDEDEEEDEEDDEEEEEEEEEEDDQRDPKAARK